MSSILSSQSFTIEYHGLSVMLKSECGVSTLFNPRNKHIPHPEFHKYEALWDTGATATVITKKVVDELGLVPIGMAQSFHANGSCMVNTYLVNVVLPNGVALHSLRVTEGILTDFDVLIGMDVITKGDFSITNKDGRTTFSFQMPSTHDINFVEEYEEEKKKAHTPIVKDKLPKRNDPCHCGSGKKYKHCHGK